MLRSPLGARRVGRGRRIVLSAIAAALTITAVLAIAILLFGEFGETEGRILATTGLLALFGVLALPAGILLDQDRRPALAIAELLLAAAGFALATTTVWVDGPAGALEKLTGTVLAFAVAAGQTGVLAVRRRDADPPSVRGLFAASTVLAAVLASLAAAAFWAELDSQFFFRVFGAAVVLDVLLVVLQPVLGLVRGDRRAYVFRLRLEPAEALELTVEAGRPALAAARAIDTVERSGRTVVALEFVEGERDLPVDVAAQRVQASLLKSS